MASHMRESLAAVLREAQCSREPLYLAEERVIGVSHAELGAYLLGLWGMPYPIVEAITHHHRPSRAPARTELGVLGATHVADFLAREQRRTDLAEPSLDRAYLTRLGVIERLQEWRDLAAEESDKARAA